MSTAQGVSGNLPNFPEFDIHSDVTSLGILWKKWTERLDNLFNAIGIDDKKRQRALMLHYGGKEIHSIYKTLTNDQTEDYAVAKGKLDLYFEPKINLTFEVYAFRQMKQHEGETVDKFTTRLREVAARCDFHDIDREIKDQIVFNTSSVKLRRKALQDNLTLTDLLKTARSFEMSHKQATVIEQSENVDREINKISKAGKYSAKNRNSHPFEDKKCFSCGGNWPHKNGKKSCPANNHLCKTCGKLNHFEKVCRSKEKVSFVADISSDSDDSYVYTVENVNMDKGKAIVTLKINSVPVKFHIDSGCSVNIINEEIYLLYKYFKLSCLKLLAFSMCLHYQ